MGPHDEELMQGRVFAAKCYWSNWEDLPEAVRQFQAEWNDLHDNRIRDVRAFIKASVAKLETHFTLLDLGGQGRGKQMPDCAVGEVGDLIRKGYTEQRTVQVGEDTRDYIEHLRFTSLKEAILMSPEIRALKEEYGVSERYLHERLQDVRPYLRYGRLPQKRVLSDQDKEDRVGYCDQMLEWLEEDPDFLLDVFWCDECRVGVNRDLAGRLRVWYDRRDVDGKPPEPIPDFVMEGSICLDLLLIVNARKGFVYVEFLTGTTDIETDGRHNPMMQYVMQLREQHGLGCYKVC
jgi:hypothetical protein